MPGQVKTRLAQAIGFEASCELYRRFGLDLFRRIQTLNLPILVFYSPPEAEADIAAWLGAVQCWPQATGDLGLRMRLAFEKGFELGYKSLLIVGSDSPDIPFSIFRSAFKRLDAGQCVIGPSDDGGYYMLGFTEKTFEPSVFSGVEWSTDSVFSTTLEKLQWCGCAVEILPEWHDVDTLDDLKLFCQRNHAASAQMKSMEYLEADLALHW